MRYVYKTATRRALLSARAAVSAAAGVAPDDLDNLLVWYDFTEISTLWKDTARTIAVSAADDDVGGVTDLSGNNYHAIGALAGYYPKYTSGGGIRRHTNMNNFVVAAGGIANGPVPFTAFFVAKRPVITSGNRSLFGWGSMMVNPSWTGGKVLVYGVNASNTYKYFGDSGTLPSWDDGGSHLFTICSPAPPKENISEVRFWIDGEELAGGTFSESSAMTTGSLRIGEGTEENFTSMEACFYSTQHSDADINALNAHLISKHGIA